jgi:hypothetical protein
LQRIAAPVGGNVNCATGAATIDLPLSMDIYLTGDQQMFNPGIQACPICAASVGNETCPGDPCAPCCHGGPNHLKPCTPATGAPGDSALNAAYPTSNDCPPDASDHLGAAPVAFALTTSALTWTTPNSGQQIRVFSGYCRDENLTLAFEEPARQCFENGMTLANCGGVFEACVQRSRGAFGPNAGAVRTIRLVGAPAGAITSGNVGSGTLVSIFSIPPTFEATVDLSANLPGPGAVSLPSGLQLLP